MALPGVVPIYPLAQQHLAGKCGLISGYVLLLPLSGIAVHSRTSLDTTSTPVLSHWTQDPLLGAAVPSTSSFWALPPCWALPLMQWKF